MLQFGCPPKDKTEVESLTPESFGYAILFRDTWIIIKNITVFQQFNNLMLLLLKENALIAFCCLKPTKRFFHFPAP